jgi:cyanate permease
MAGPFTGGILHDIFGNYQYAALVSSVLAFVVLAGWLLSDKKPGNS